MSYSYNYNFISPSKIFAEIKEELRSYFDTGIIDDMMFGRWTEYILKKIGKAAYPKKEVILKVEDFMTDLPENLYRVREVYQCHRVDSIEVPSANSTYVQKSYLNAQNLTYEMCEGCVPDCVTIVEKTQGSTIFTFKMSTLLVPGNIHTASMCDYQCDRGKGDNDLHSYDIHGNKIIVRFREGILYFKYYEESLDDDYNQQVPDFPEFENYLKNYIKYKCFEVIYNSVTDETYKQVEGKLLYYKQQYEEAFIIAKCELMKKTPYQTARDITKIYRRFRDLEM